MLRRLLEIKWSALAFAVAAVLGVLGMGALGGGLFYLAAPLLPARLDSFGELTGDWVWPAMIVAGLAWSPAFLLAGLMDRRLSRRCASPATRVLAYTAVLWLCAVLVWRVVLLTAAPGT